LVRRFPSPHWPLLVFFGDDRREFGRWCPTHPAPESANPPSAPPGPAEDGQDLARALARILAPYAGLPVP
jgi:hypothetical protein